jgi:WS/DGAT/MGAT family acyltransferase
MKGRHHVAGKLHADLGADVSHTPVAHAVRRRFPMAYSYYERLTALDATFLDVEDHNAHMHVGAVALFDAAPLLGPDGLVDLDRIGRVIEVGLHRIPRYQQRLASIPLFGYPVWVDDPHFNLHYHLRHVRLPAPGSERLLKRLAGRIMSQQLDRGKPLWELWVVEGVEGNRIALITKVHHCMVDGVGSVELTNVLMRATPEIEAKLDHPREWLPRPIPKPAELFLGEVARRGAEPLAALDAVTRALSSPRRAVADVRDAVLGIAEALGAGLRQASPTPLNPDIGPHRRFDWLTTDLATIQAIRSQLGGTVNDVVLAIVAGALGRFLHARGLRPEELDFRAMIPVNVRQDHEREHMGNRITMMVAQLPLGERDPRRRLQRVCEATRALKHSHQGLGVKTLEDISDWTLASLFFAFAKLASLTRPYNIVVTNVPGPAFPAYFLGAQMRAVYPLVPLYRNQGLGIALFSYDGGLHWGFNADWDALPDLHDVVEAAQDEVERLRSAAALGPLIEAPRTPPRSRKKRAA